MKIPPHLLALFFFSLSLSSLSVCLSIYPILSTPLYRSLFLTPYMPVYFLWLTLASSVYDSMIILFFFFFSPFSFLSTSMPNLSFLFSYNLVEFFFLSFPPTSTFFSCFSLAIYLLSGGFFLSSFFTSLPFTSFI